MSSERYQRHSLIDWFSQEDVFKASIAIVGCGAVGNEVAKNLALLGVKRLSLFDLDEIEHHNLTRSVLFRDEDVGHPKVLIAKKRLEEIESTINVAAYHGDFWNTLTLKMLETFDCVICCVDNFEARLKINQLCLLTRTDLINTGIDSKFSQVEVYPFNKAKDVACFECNLPISAYEKIHERYSCGWLRKVSFIERKIPTTIITSSLTGSLAAAWALNIIRAQGADISSRVLTDTFTGRSSTSEFTQNLNCPACGDLRENISILSSRPRIENQFNFTETQTSSVILSEPVVVSASCVECDIEKQSIFKKASEFDSTFTVCPECLQDTMEVVIKDTFSLFELNSQFSGKDIPVKYVRFDTDSRTHIIEMEN